MTAVPEEQFWTARPVLQHVRDFAQSRRVCPWSTIGVVLVRAVCQFPAHVVFPPMVGGEAAVNLFTALVGPSGAGKGAAKTAGRDAIIFDGPGAAIDIPELPIGSGEGISRALADAAPDSPCVAIFSASEVDTVAALFRRAGSTLEAELRKLWMGETLGFSNKSSRTIVPRLSYRAGLIVGVQPLRSASLLGGADGGTPQRLLWLPVLDAGMPATPPDPVGSRIVQVPVWPRSEEGHHIPLEVPEIARVLPVTEPADDGVTVNADVKQGLSRRQ